MVHYVIFISFVIVVSYIMSHINKIPAKKIGLQKSTNFGFNVPWITYANAQYPTTEEIRFLEDEKKPQDLANNEIFSSKLALVNDQIGNVQIADDIFVKDISLIVVDTEGLAYRTNFSRNLVWVSRLTKNMLKMNKPSLEKYQVCAIEDIAGKKITRKRIVENDIFSERKDRNANDKKYKGPNDMFTRHLVPSYDGYVYYVDEHHTKLLQIHVKDIVNYTPLYTHLLEGVYLQGHRKSTILALDFETGDHIMRHNTGGPASDEYEVDYIMPNIDEKRQQIHIGYTDWSVKAYSERKHQEIWSFNWREIGSVNTEMKNDHIVQNIRNIITVNNNNLRFNISGLSKSESELQFPFPITSVFAVFESKRDGIHTLELISRIPLPPPTQFLLPHPINSHSTLRLSSSNNIKGKSLFINDDIIKVVDSYRPDNGIVLKIMDSINHRNLVIKELYDNKPKPGIDESTTFLLKWWWLLISWVIAIVLTPLVWIYRRVRKQVHKHFDNPIDNKSTNNNIDMLSSNSSQESSKSDFSEPDNISLDRYSDVNLSVDHKLSTELRRAKSEGNFFTNEQDDPFSKSVWIEEQSLINVFGSTKQNKFQRGNILTKSNNGSVLNKKDVLEKEANSSALSVIPSTSILAKFLENGRFLRTFECIKLLGKGGFGAVYRAQHRLEPGNPIYAVKFVLLRLKASEDLSSRRYFREVAANRDIYSKYVVRYYTWWCEEPHFLPLAQMTRELQIAAANNVRHLIDTKAISAQKSRELDDYLQQYHDIVCQYIQNPSSDDAFPNFSKIAQSIKNRVSKIPKLFIRRNRRQNVQERGSSCAAKRNNTSKGNSNDSSEFPYASEGSHIQFKETIEEGNQKLSSDTDKSSFSVINTNTPKEQEKQFPVVLLILMEMCNGFTLRQWLNRPSRSDKPLEFLKGHNGKTVEFELFKQLIKGLRDIHSNCFIHRDLKPENIFVDLKTHALKIGDLGLVGFIEENSHSSVSGTITSAKAHLLSDATQVSVRGQVIGTPGYTAPEGGGNCTEKADIYSAALILLELLCPRFNTVMERLDTLENFRKSHDAPQFIKIDLKPWYELMVHMADQCPEKRPSAEEVYQRLKIILKS
ncbi:protein kinase domain containing protein [Theileria equi strain WA]|uniref:non-specific serine/threonine protein kinase n=1 Tax=Theileria equi strain WA TaxID=1537102 RepID=L1LFZ2_THEEQ|nr:protein kinase domain containing protein [Theileria equi strain WA]EKX74256.1 protein kinase domain containing protein [Theileria equi strain WA]|eukprot:XP_004833708.1 protein kinase domain containing protein [Theileria equi strain WA]